MFLAHRVRSRASIKRAVTVLTLAAFISTGFSFGILTPSRGTIASAATPTVDAPALRNDPPDGKGKAKKDRPSDLLSGMGLLAQHAQAAVAHAQGKKFQGVNKDFCTDQDDDCEATFDPDTTTPIAGGQAETSIAVDSTGQHVVVGFNDTRGFAVTVNPTSVSGFMYSDDGGATFAVNGLLPITVPQTAIGATKYPQAFGDPEVKYLGGSSFAYVEIMVKTISATGTAQTMGFHLSTDYGHTWTGPFEIPSATNPHGLLSGANARDAADKEFADFDPTAGPAGRLMMSWSNFTSTAFAPGGVEISTTYTDDILDGSSAVWSSRQIVGNIAADGQASIPRFARGSSNAYVAWRRFPGGTNQNVGFARSLDKGVTWQPTINLTTDFFTADQILGNDRINTSPSLAVDNGVGSNAGNLYVVYENNGNHDGGDIAFQRSTDAGVTWSAAKLINSRPGNDRAQWFPWVTVDAASGRVGVFYYDQGTATSGDLTEVTYTYSDDGGTTWSRPTAISDRPFQAGWGNDTGQPNIGDYNQAIAQGGELFAVFASTESKGFANGQPSGNYTTPDVTFKRVSSGPRASLRLGSVSFAESGGNGKIDAGETVTLTIPLENYVTNALSAGTLTGITAGLTTATPGVSVVQGASAYPAIGSGASAPNTTAFVIQTTPAFVLGTKIELTVAVSTAQGPATLRYSQLTGTPSATTFFSENFNGVAPGALPAGWVTSHGGGTNTVPWTTSSTFSPCAGSNGAFHINANDATNPTRFERLFSPTITVPASASYVTLDFDVCFDTEDDPAFNIQAFDGLTLRVTDLKAGDLVRSDLIEAFAEGFKTGSLAHFPKHLPRNSSSAYFQDMSVWAGDSHGLQHVSMRLPGMAGYPIQLRWEYTQDSSATCANVRLGHSCGVFVDNIVLQSVTNVAGTSVAITSPAGGTLTNQTSIAVTGTQSNATAVTVNGTAATISAGTWSATVALPAEGLNTLTATATGAVDSATASVTVRRDTTPPVITAPADTVAEATSSAGAIVTYGPCLGSDASTFTIGYSQASGTQFPLGTTPVTCTATDAAGNSASASFNVKVQDTTPPSVAASSGATAEATGPSGAIVSYAPCTAADLVTSSPTITYSQDSGTLFDLGTTFVICTARDAAGNTAAATFQVAVLDTTAPSITGTAAPAANANGWNSSNVAVSFDCHDIVAVLSCTATQTVGEGVWDVKGTAIDTSGNTATADVFVKVDKTKPTITFAGDHAYQVTETVLVNCIAADALSGIDTSSCGSPLVNAPASTFTIGTHTVTASATDRAGNVTTATTTFTVGVTFTSLCDLTRSLSTSLGVADSLCAKLANASAAQARGSNTAAGNILDAYQNELRAQSGKALPAAAATLLSGLADALR